MERIWAAFEEAAENSLEYAERVKRDTGKRVIGIFPMHFPVELAHAGGALPIVIQEDQAPVTVGHAHVYNFYCGYNRSLTDQLLLGKFDFLDGILFGDHCVQLLGTADVIRDQRPNIPILFNQLISSLSASWAFSESQYTFRQLWKELEELVGRKITAESAQASFRLYNRDRQLMRKLFELRREGKISLSGRQLQLVVKSSMVMEVEKHIALVERLTELLLQGPPAKDGVRVYISGHYCQAPKPEILDAIEHCGGIIVDDDLYHGFRFISTDIDETGDPIDAFANWYLRRNRAVPCATVVDEGADWDKFLLQAVAKSRAQGLIVLQVKFCEPHMYFYPEIKEAFENEGIPHLLIETEHEQMPIEALKTRIETFLEVVKRRSVATNNATPAKGQVHAAHSTN